jgi:exodeoxyribonuclease VII small subunit
MSSFKQAYQTLERIVSELESGEADVDQLIPLLEEAARAYQSCRAQLEAVRKLLESSDQSGEAPEGGVSREPM